MKLLQLTSLFLLLFAAPAAGKEIGRDIFSGRTQTESKAFLSAANISVPVGRVACGRCHGADGMGHQEGTIFAPPIIGSALRRDTARRPAYTTDSIIEAVEKGRDPAGRELDPAMPRFKLTREEIASVLEYLDVLPDEQRKGIDDATVRIGIVYEAHAAPLAKRLRDLTAAAALRAARSGIHGRQIEVIPVPVDGVGDIVGFANNPEVAALVFPLVRDGEKLLSSASIASLPVLFPMFQLMGDERPAQVRGLLPGRADQIRTVLGGLEKRWPIIGAGNDKLLRLARELSDKREFLKFEDISQLPEQFVFFGAASGLERILQLDIRGRIIHGLADDLGPYIEQFIGAGARVQIADPFAWTTGTGNRLEAMVDAAVSVLTLALVRAGRDLTRARLIAAFDGVEVQNTSWPALDYKRIPLTGTKTVTFQRFGY